MNIDELRSWVVEEVARLGGVAEVTYQLASVNDLRLALSHLITLIDIVRLEVSVSPCGTMVGDRVRYFYDPDSESMNTMHLYTRDGSFCGEGELIGSPAYRQIEDMVRALYSPNSRESFCPACSLQLGVEFAIYRNGASKEASDD